MPHPYVGMWVTADGFIRQELLPNGRYDEARGYRASAYTGHYTLTGSHIDYVDDTGFTATGDVRNGVLYHEHLVLYREGELTGGKGQSATFVRSRSGQIHRTVCAQATVPKHEFRPRIRQPRRGKHRSSGAISPRQGPISPALSPFHAAHHDTLSQY